MNLICYGRPALARVKVFEGRDWVNLADLELVAELLAASAVTAE
jgi:hypothetical protein